MILGNQITFAARVLRENTSPTAGGRTNRQRRELVTLCMQVVVSLAVLAGAAFILSKGGTKAQEKAIWTAVGVVVGYWLH
jgi:hypothetical protein